MSITTSPSAGSVDVKLTYPINIDGQAIDTITLRRPKVKDSLDASRKHPSEGLERALFLLARLSSANGQPLAPEHLHELDDADAGKLNDAYEGFRDAGAS